MVAEENFYIVNFSFIFVPLSYPPALYGSLNPLEKMMLLANLWRISFKSCIVCMCKFKALIFYNTIEDNKLGILIYGNYMFHDAELIIRKYVQDPHNMWSPSEVVEGHHISSYTHQQKSSY